MRWLVFGFVLLFLGGCSIRYVEQEPSDVVEVEEFSRPIGVYQGSRMPLYSINGGYASRAYDAGLRSRVPVSGDGVYDPRPVQRQTDAAERIRPSIPQRAPVRQLSRQPSSERLTQVQSGERMVNVRRKRSVEKPQREPARRVRQKSREDEDEKEDAALQRKQRLKRRP